MWYFFCKMGLFYLSLFFLGGGGGGHLKKFKSLLIFIFYTFFLIFFYIYIYVFFLFFLFWIFSGRFDTSGSMITLLVSEISPLDAFCDRRTDGRVVVVVVAGIVDSRSLIYTFLFHTLVECEFFSFSNINTFTFNILVKLKL